MALKVNKEEKIMKLMDELSNVQKQIFELRVIEEELRTEILEVKIAPFKIGDTVMFNCPSGRSRKVRKCVLECEGGLLYARPLKADNNPSGNRYLVSPINKSYQEVLQEVKE